VKPIKIVASDPDIEIEVPVGNFGARLVGGLGGFEEVERQDDVSATDWVGQAALRQDISILLDGYATGDSVERELNTILKLGRDPNGERVPPVFRVWGPVYYEGKAWVLPPDGIDLDGGEIEPIRRPGNGELLRQEVILHLLEFNPPDTIRIRGKHAKHGRTAVGKGRVVSRRGDTLHSLAARELGDWKRWPELSEASGVRDPLRELPEGTELFRLSQGPSESQILNDYHRFAKWALRHGYEAHMGTGAWIGLLESYADNQGVSSSKMTDLHGSDPGGGWRTKWDEGRT
jgi:hypothetical protein